MAARAVAVEGYRQLQRDFGRMSKDLRKDLRSQLKEIGGIVADDARQRAAAYSDRTARSIRPKVRTADLSVQDTARKVTGKRPDYGKLVMRRVLLPAREAKQRELMDGLETMLDKLGHRYGF